MDCSDCSDCGSLELYYKRKMKDIRRDNFGFYNVRTKEDIRECCAKNNLMIKNFFFRNDEEITINGVHIFEIGQVGYSIRIFSVILLK